METATRYLPGTDTEDILEHLDLRWVGNIPFKTLVNPKLFKITVEEVQIKDQWWCWWTDTEKWESSTGTCPAVGHDWVRVYGNECDRAAKRDKLLAVVKEVGDRS